MKEKEITISIVYIFGIHITVRRPDWKKRNFIVFSPDPPHQVELRSSGKAGEYQGDLLGVYQMLPEPGRGEMQPTASCTIQMTNITTFTGLALLFLMHNRGG